MEDARRADHQRLVALLLRRFHGQRMLGLNNIELITDRPLDVNFREISEVKRRYPQHALIVSLMVESSARPGTPWCVGRKTAAPTALS